ncbi:MAG: pyridoxamine 5'-phosphate oxidase [Actinomycetota bacterium]|nr:pyridoxamine 5'-phosphate oxidase [Actinomycetota bacterium]
MRHDYEAHGLHEADVTGDAMEQFERWFEEAVAAGVREPNAMVLATVVDDTPTTRHVLLKGLSQGGFEFFTNYGSRKGAHLAENDRVALTFGWLDLHRQVNISGRAHRLTATESDEYFAVRPREAQLGAWASHQSSLLTDRSVLDQQLEEARRRFAGGPVPRPEHWGGYRVVAESVEFWQGRPSRLHDRLLYNRVPSGWHIQRLSP